MPRMLSEKPCEVTFYDRISDSRITLFYRLPTTEERIKYTNSMITRRANKVESTIGNARLKHGADILLGFREGAFETEKGLFSSEEKSPNYDPEWKNHIKKYAPDVIEMLAIHVFEASLVSVFPDENGGEPGENP